MLYRVYLRDGSMVLSYGEFARVADRVVVSVPLGNTVSAPELHLLSIPSDSVDWEKTDAYAESVRAIAAHTERLDPTIATTAFVKDERAGKVFVDSTRVGGATVIAAYSPRLRPGVPVSFPVSWDELGRVSPADFTIRNALELLGDTNPWAAQMVAPQHLGVDLIAEGHEIPGGRVQAMHEGKRRARARRT